MARSTASCLVFSPDFVKNFDADTLSEWLMVCPKICLLPARNADSLLLISKNATFEFVSKPFRPKYLKAILDRAFAEYQQGFCFHNRFDNLTRREQQTCEILASGHPNKEIADRLGISIKTVQVHRANLMRKIEVKSIADLLRAYNTHQALPNNAGLTLEISADGIAGKATSPEQTLETCAASKNTLSLGQRA